MRARFFLLVLLALAARAAARVDVVVDSGGELGRKAIRRIVAAPRDLARLREVERIDWIGAAESQLLSEARTHGRLDARVAASIDSLDSIGNFARVSIRYSEGPLYSFAGRTLSIESVGAPPLDTARIPFPVGRFEQEAIVRTIQEINLFYQRRGYLDAATDFELSIDTATRQVVVSFAVSPGRAVVYGGMEIQGLRLTRSSLIRGLWPVSVDDTVRPRDLTAFSQKLYQTRLFSGVGVSYDISPVDSSLRVVRLRVRERVPGSVDAALSWEPTFGVGLEGNIRHRNVRGSMNEVSLGGKIAQKDQQLELGWGTPLVFNTLTRMDYTLLFRQQSAALADTTVFREFTIANEGKFTYPLAAWAGASLTLNTERVTKFRHTSETDVLYRYTALTGLGVDFRDQPLDATRGWSANGLFGYGGDFGFDSAYTWVQGQTRAYVPLVWGSMAAFAIDGGRFFNTATLDAAARFWQGGGRSVRSWPFQEIRVEDSTRNLQPRFVRGSTEFRQTLFEKIQLVGFVDGARVWNRGEAPALLERASWKLGYGFGARYRLSFLNLRLDYALGQGEDRWYFDLAQSF